MGLTHVLINCMYRGWEGQNGVVIFTVHFSLIALATSSLSQQMEGRHMLLGLSNLFEMYPPSMQVDLVVSLCILGSKNTTLMQIDPLVSVCIHLYQFSKRCFVQDPFA